MSITVIIKYLYAVNGVVAVLMYVPQIVKVWRDGNSAPSVSLLTFGGWSVGSLITVLYAWALANDLMFATVSLGSMIGSSAVFCLAATKRLRAIKCATCGSGEILPTEQRRTPRFPVIAQDRADA